MDVKRHRRGSTDTSEYALGAVDGGSLTASPLLPEARGTADLHASAAPEADGEAPLAKLRRQAAECTACPLYKDATQTVFGAGPSAASIMLVGEQPGDQEDRRGLPFVGPAGAVLDRALRDAGIDRRTVYVTNAVKHFKFVIRGKKRLHQKPKILEIDACRRWLEAEITFVEPRVVVALGTTAARGLLRRDVAIGAARGKSLRLPSGTPVVVTIHPSYLLRIQDEMAKAGEYELFVGDLVRAAASVSEAGH